MQPFIISFVIIDVNNKFKDYEKIYLCNVWRSI